MDGMYTIQNYGKKPTTNVGCLLFVLVGGLVGGF